MELRRESTEVKILAISGGGQFNGLKLLPMSLVFGANAVMEKPLNISKLLQIIDKL